MENVIVLNLYSICTQPDKLSQIGFSVTRVVSVVFLIKFCTFGGKIIIIILCCLVACSFETIPEVGATRNSSVQCVYIDIIYSGSVAVFI